MTSAFRHIVIVPVALALIVWLASCQQAVPAGNDQRETTVTVVCDALGWSSEEVESKVTLHLEESLNGIRGLQRISSVSRPGQAVIRVTFGRGTATLQARQIVAEQVTKVPLPDNVDVKLAPIASDEMLLIVMRDDTPVDSAREINEQAVRLRDVADDSLRKRLLTVTGVSEVVVAGGRRKQYQVFPSAEKLAAFDITPSELATAIRRANTAVGDLPLRANKEVLIRTVSQLQALEDIADTLIKATADGAVVRVKDVAGVRIGWISDIAQESGEANQGDATDTQAVVLAVQLQPNADKTAVNNKINEVLKHIQQQLPKGVKTQRKVDRHFNQIVRNLINKLQQDLPPNVKIEQRTSERLGDILVIVPSRRITVMLYGPDLAVLRKKADEVHERMKGVPGAFNPLVHPQPNIPQLKIEIDRDVAERLGVTPRQVADAFSIAAGNHAVSKVREGNREYDLVMKRKGDDELRRTPVRTTSGALAPIGQVAKITITAAPSAICRENGHRVIFISCDVKDRRLAEVESDIKKSVGPLPNGYSIDIGH
jgi:Cu/Ag efflux pump CusA